MTPGESEDLPLPRLREDLRLLKGAPTIIGKPTWLIFDPVVHRYYQIDQDVFRLLSLWNWYPTAGKLLEVVRDDFGAMIDDKKIAAVTEFVNQHNLVLAPLDADWRHYHARAISRDTDWWKTAVHSYLFFRIPLVRPSRLLKKALPFVEPFMSRPFLLFALVIALAGLYLTSRQWDKFLATFADFFSIEGALVYVAALMFIKIIHELAHAFTAARFGCRVPTMGVAFLVMFPVLYTDVTDAWKLTSRRQRLLIGAAGMIAEVVLAAFATFMWAFLPDGTAKSVCFVVATTGWILSLAVNLNPFMRFDGYYLFADAIGIENLQPRAFAVGRWRLRELLFDVGADCPETLPRSSIRLLAVYAWGTWIYRLFLFVAIALLVYYLFFKVLGLLLFAVEIIWFIARPVWAELKEWFKMKDAILKRPRTYVTVCVLAGVAALGLLPLSTSIDVPAVAEAEQFERIFPVIPAQLKALHVERNQLVTKGQTLIELTSPQLANQLRLTQIKLQTIRSRLDRAVGDQLDREQMLVLQREQALLFERRAGLRRQLKLLTIAAPFDGRIVDIRPRLHAGRWVGRDAPLLSIAANGGQIARGYLSERDLWRVSPGAAGRFIPDDITQAPSDVHVTKIAYANSANLDLIYLASQFGGPIAATRTDQRELVPAEAQYLVTMRLEDAAIRTGPVQRGVVKVSGRPESVLSRFWRQTLKVLVRESGA